MCDFSAKLTAWLDHELAADDAADFERHLHLCAECRNRLEAYRHLSGTFDAYCDAYCLAAERPRRRLFRQRLALSGTAAVAAAIAGLFLLVPRARVPSSPLPTPAPVAGPATVSHPEPPVQDARTAAAPMGLLSPIERPKPGEQRRRGRSPGQGQEVSWYPPGPAVEIAIPADAIFPPGAVPEGFSFAADVTIAPDGSAQQIGLRLQLAEFERRSTRP